MTDGTATFHRLPLLRGEHLGGRMVGNGGLQVLTAKREGLRAVAVSEETEVADLDEAQGQDVEKEAADEFHRFQRRRHCLRERFWTGNPDEFQKMERFNPDKSWTPVPEEEE